MTKHKGRIAWWALWILLANVAVAEVTLLPLPQPYTLSLTDKQLATQQRSLEQLAAAGDYSKALIPAKKLADVLASDPRLGPQARENYALALLQSGDFSAGVDNLQQVLNQLRESGNFRDPRLARPLLAMGVALHQLQDFQGAIEHIEQGNFILRTDKGLESLEQTAHDDILLDSLVKTGRLEDALNRLDASLTIQRQALSSGPELEQALARAASWYRSLDAAWQESLLQEERLELAANRAGSDSPELVPIYYDLANSYSRRMHDDLDKLRDIKSSERNVSYSFARSDQIRRAMNYEYGNRQDDRALLDAEWKAVRALKVALRIQEDQPEPDIVAIANTYVRLGDHYQLIGDSRKARRYYQRAWDLFSENGATEYLAEVFSNPVPIYQRPLKLPATTDPETLSAYQGEAELVLDVNSRGQPRNIELLEVRPKQASILEDKAVRYSRDTIFRPRFTDKGTVVTEKMRYIYQFQPQREQ